MVATKGSFGEYAAAGALQLAAALEALRDRRLPATVGFEEKDPQLPAAPASGGAAALRHVLVNSISAGGGIVCAVLSASSS